MRKTDTIMETGAVKIDEIKSNLKTRKVVIIPLVLLALLFLPTAAWAAVQLDVASTQTGAATASLTWSHAIGNYNNRVLVVGVQSEDTSCKTISSVKFNNVNLTQINSTSATSAGTYQCVSLWYLVAPTVTTANVVVTWASSVGNATAGAISLYNVVQSAPEANATNFNNSGATTTNITTLTDGAWVVDMFGSGNGGALFATVGQIARFTNTSGSTTAGGGSTKPVVTAGATSVTWSQSGGVNRSAQVAASFAPTVTTLGNGTDPGNTTIAPGAAATMADAFTLQSNSGTDTCTAATVTLAAGTSGGLSLVEITNDAGTVVHGSVTNPASDTPSISLTTNITVTTTSTQYKVRVTPKSHANMPAPPGSAYSVTASITSGTCDNTTAGSDSAGTTVTIDNLSPGNVTGSTATPGDSQVSLAWTNPADADLGSIIVLRRTGGVVADTPVEGTTYAVGNTIGSSTVACVVSAPTASCTDTGRTNGTSYYYKIFTRDDNGNYSATGAVPTGSPATPNPFKPDGMIKLSAEADGSYLTDNTYEATAAVQVKTNGVVSGSTAAYALKFQNDGPSTDSLLITGTGNGSGFTVQYLDETSTDRTAAVTGAGYTIASLAAGASKVWTLNVTPGGSVTGNTSYNVYVTATSSTDGTKTDQVKATTSSTSAVLTLLKSADKANAAPGEEISYSVTASNGAGLTAASSVVLTDPIPTDTGFKVGGASFNAGTSTLTNALSYSDDGGSTWTYTPVSGGCSAPAGYDYCVNKVKWTTSGSMPSGTSFSIGLVVVVK